MKRLKHKLTTITTLAFFASGLALYACDTYYAQVTLSGWTLVRNCYQTRSVLNDGCAGPSMTDCVANLKVYLSQDGLWNGVACVEWENDTGDYATVHQTVACPKGGG